MNAKDREWRFSHLVQIGCICCALMGYARWPVEIHHLNLDGKAGQVRRGDEYTLPLCRWHHQADWHGFASFKDALEMLGPNLKSSRAFHLRFGTDDELLVKVNWRLDRMRALVVS